MPTYKNPTTNHLVEVLAVSSSSSGNNIIVTAQAGKKIYVTEVFLIPDADSVKIKFMSGATDLTGQLNLSKAGNGFIIPTNHSPYWLIPHLVTDVGENLILNLSAAVAVTGYIHYYME